MLRRLCLLLIALPCALQAADLTVKLHGRTITYTDSQLRQRPDVRSIDLPNDVAYHGATHYRAVPLKALLPGLKPTDHLQFVALDGFAAEVPSGVLLNDKGSEALLAIEDPAHPWPNLPGKDVSAGPFYVVWLRPRAAGINPEQWPYQLSTIRQLENAAERFPAMQPGHDASARVQRGFEVFQRICLACHTLNGQGDARLGPDLNAPRSPTEYMQAGYLRQYIRDPQSLRHWPQAKMPGFKAQVLSDTDLDAVIDYLGHMAKQRKP
ncbi:MULTISPECIES: c-type cytochrome [Dyella]|uniref:C-type cytochrome n=2 Tax=Dyella TaxID=231454 RepID=A0A4R0Z1H8_9GAMM|nr:MULTISPECIES: c-type cytochrome [Dyella]TBR38955.1 c-type cytochrome [Dyella terrae]TCI13454.1 c-type cytochrome [Dyella soli]